MREIKESDLKEGIIVADTGKMCAVTTLLSFLKFDEDGDPAFKVICGECYYIGYMCDGEKIISLKSKPDKIWKIPSKKEIEQWKKDYKIGI